MTRLSNPVKAHNKVMPATDKHGNLTSKLLRYCWVYYNFSVLVPKKRGIGYLKSPYGHHHIERLSEIGHQVGCDICGLDGSLDFEVPSRLYCSMGDEKTEFEQRLMPLLEKYYGFSSEPIDIQAYWDIKKNLFNKDI